MATRKKKKQRTMQLMASAALLGTTVAPYVISADELTTNQLDNTNEALQNNVEITTQTTGDSANISSGNENTIDKGSEITSSAGNTTTESIDNGIVNSTTVTGVEAINPTTFAAPAALSAATAPTDIIWSQSIPYTVKTDPTDQMASFIDGYLLPYFSNAEVVQVGDDQFVQLTLTGKAYGFSAIQYIDVAGAKQDVTIVSSEGEKLDQVRVIRLPIITDENGVTKLFVDSGDLGYGAYTLFFSFDTSNVTAPEAVVPVAPTVKHVEKNVNFQFTAGADFETGSQADPYLKAFVTQADLVIGEDGKPYADITFGGHSYAGTAIKVGSAEGPDAEIISSTGTVATSDLVRTVRVALDADYRADIFFGSSRGNYTFKFDLAEEKTKFNFTSGTASDAYFSLWAPHADLVETATGDKYAYITLAGHSYAVGTITVDGQPADIISSTGSAATSDLTRVVRVKLDAANQAALALDGGEKGTYTFTFDFTKQVETPFADTLTADFQAVELDITAGIPAMFIVLGAIEAVQAKKVTEGITFSIQTTKAESVRGYYKTFIVKQNGNVVKEVSAENNEIAEFTVASLDGLTIDVVFATPSTSSADTSTVETIYTGTVTGAKLVVDEPEQTTPDTSAVNPGDYTTGSDLDEAVFTEQAKKVKFTFKSLVNEIPSAAALGVIVPEATVTKKDDKYEVTLQVNPVRTDRLFITQKGQEIATVDTTNGEKTTLTFTVDNLDHLFFYVDGVSGAATGSIETIIGAEVTGYEVIDATEQPTTPETSAIELPTPDQLIDANASFTFSTGEVATDSYMKSYIKNAKIVRIGSQLYADIELTGHTYAYTSIKLGSKNGADASYASNGLTGNDLVRTIRVPLDENKKSVVAMYGGNFDNLFTFDFVPVPKVLVNTAADLKAQDQALALAYNATNSATSWHAAALSSSIKAVAAKAVNGKVQVTVQVATDGLNSFTVTQNGQGVTSWTNTSSLVTFTVDSLENLVFSLNKTAAQGTSTMSVNVTEASLNPTGALPAETVVAPPVTPVTPEQPTQSGETAITYTMVADPNGQMADFITGYLNPYFSNAKLVTRDGKKFVRLTLSGKAYGFTKLQYIDAAGTKHNVTTLSSTGTGLEQVRVIELPLIQDANSVSKMFVDSSEYGSYTLFFTFKVGTVPAPTQPSNNSTIINKPTDLKVAKNTPTLMNFLFGSAQSAIATKLKALIPAPKVIVTDDNKLTITFTVAPQDGVNKLVIKRNGIKIGEWKRTGNFARVASLLPFFAANSNDITLEGLDGLDGITFEVVDDQGATTILETAVEVASTLANSDSTTVSPTTPGGSVGGGAVTGNVGNVTNREPITYKMVAPGNDFITNYLAPYFSNAEVVTVDGKNFIELTLTGKAYGFVTITATGGGKIVSSEGEAMDQVRVFRFPAKKDVTIFVDSGDLGYGSYNLEFTFDLSEQQIANAAAQGTGGLTAVQTITPQIVSEGDVKFTIPAESSGIVAYAKKLSAKLINGKYNVDLTLSVNADLDTFVVKQGDKVLATWDKKNKGVTGSNVTTEVISFTVDSLENITFTATTKNRTLTAKVGAELPKKEEVQQATKDGRQSMTYTMVADPTGPMADFITGYLAPYFSNAVYVTENGKEFVELTLTGKAYGFQKLQYIDADGKNVDIEVVSSKGEGLDQVRVVRLPLVQDKDGITKIFVDSGELGYGAYTLFFKFNVPVKLGELATVANPFKDIDGVYSKDDILALYAAGITTGTTETSFSPNANMTRAQFAVMVARALGVSSSKETQFKDIQGKWYAAEVQALAEIGIITGVSDTKFKPGDKITRQQAAVMIHRMLKYKGYTNTTTAEALNFKDNAKVADYAKEALAELQAQGIMTGSDGKVNPKANLTRAQMAKILKNAADLVDLLN